MIGRGANVAGGYVVVGNGVGAGRSGRPPNGASGSRPVAGTNGASARGSAFAAEPSGAGGGAAADVVVGTYAEGAIGGRGVSGSAPASPRCAVVAASPGPPRISAYTYDGSRSTMSRLTRFSS